MQNPWVGEKRVGARLGILVSVAVVLGLPGAAAAPPEVSVAQMVADAGGAPPEPSDLTDTVLASAEAGNVRASDPCSGRLPSAAKRAYGPAMVSGVGSAGLRLRSGPGTQFSTHLVLRDGALVFLSGDTSADEDELEWSAIRDHDLGGGGWASAQYLRRVDLCELTAEDDRLPAVLGKVLVARITAYTYQEPEGGADGVVTKSGLPVAWGMVAVDPRVIPLGTSLLIEGFSQRFVARDTGFGVLGAHVDIFFPDLESAIQFGVQQREVVILAESCVAEKDPSTCRGSG